MLSGCLQFFTTISVNPDGSGEIEEKVLFGKNLLDLFQSLSSMFQDSTKEISVNDIFSQEEITKQAEKFGAGTKLTAFEKINSGELSGYSAKFSFTDISKIKIDQNPDSKMPSFGQEENTESKEQTVGFQFEKGKYSNLKIILPNIESNEEFDSSRMAQDSSEFDQKQIDEFVEMFDQLKVSLKIKVNGEIISTNAHHVDGGTITLINFDIKQVLKNPELMKLFREQKPSNISDMEKFADLIPGFQIEFNNIVDVTFK